MGKHVAIIGGGAAGMMTMASLREHGYRGAVTLFERNRALGAKVIISGGGRCNVTTGVTEIDALMAKYPRGGRFLRSALRAFGPAQIRAWFEAQGVRLKEEADGRVFPVSDNGRDIVRVFEKMIAATPHLRCVFGASVQSVTQRDGTFYVVYRDAVGRRVEEAFDIVVLTTGGNAYAQTGSRGDGYAFARALGHTVTPLGPSLSSFLAREPWVQALSGTSFPNAQIVAQRADGRRVSVDGPVLLTHFGVSGPAVFAFAAAVAHEVVSEKQPLQVRVRIAVTSDYAAWQERLTAAFARNGAKSVAQVLKVWMTQHFAQVICAQCGIAPEKKCAEIARHERSALAHILGDGFALTLTARRPGDEFVTAGGVALREVCAKTGQSRHLPGLYFAGEILDIDGVTGGFNLTASWAMGRLVGRAIPQNKKV